MFYNTHIAFLNDGIASCVEVGTYLRLVTMQIHKRLPVCM